MHWKCSRLIALLSGRGYRQTRSWPFGSILWGSEPVRRLADELLLLHRCSWLLGNTSVQFSSVYWFHAAVSL